MILKEKCHICNNVFDIEVDEDRYKIWKYGIGLIQNILPELTPDERELLISHTCGKCFDDLFKEE